MRTRLSFLLVLVLLFAVTGSAQRENRPRANAPRANHGRVPPPPEARGNRGAAPEAEHGAGGRVNSTQHVNNDHWYGHDRPNDPRFHLAHPFEHGRFEKVGPSFRYEVARIDAAQRRLWLPGGFFFEVAAWDWPVCVNWCWDCGDDFAIYGDPDHVGWYLLYNIHTGEYVHVLYLGT